MNRSKQQALMFLLGAFLVGGALGFSADRMFDHGPRGHWAPRDFMYDDLDLSADQRATLDTILDARRCQMDSLFRPIKPVLDSLKEEAHKQVLSVLTPSQRRKLEERRHEMDQHEAARHEAAHQRGEGCS
jgi:Spy/CpxP family protein refolding chaperone